MRYSRIDLFTTSDRIRLELVLVSRLDVQTLLRQVRDKLIALDFPAADQLAIHSALKAALVKALQHCDRLNCSKQIRVALLMDPNEFRIRIRATGNTFDTAPDSRAFDIAKLGAQNVDDSWSIFQCMGEVRRNKKGNMLTLIRRRSCRP